MHLLSRIFGFRGTPDFIGLLTGEKNLSIVDWKTSVSIQQAWQLQVSGAYRILAEENGYKPIERCLSLRLDKNGGQAKPKDYGNLIIMRTLSKIGLAGLRIGFLIADERIIDEVNKVRLPFNLNALSQAAALEALRNKTVMKKNIRMIISERNKLFTALSNIAGITAYPSEANFILFKVKDPDRIYHELLKRGVLVRDMKGVVEGCLRVTVGSPEENSIFIRALKNIPTI